MVAGDDGEQPGVDAFWTTWRRGVGAGLRVACSEVMPPLCPVCRAVPRPVGAWACDPCAEAMGLLPTPRCPQCGGACDGALAICGECLRAGERPWAHAVSAFAFRGLAREAVHRLKYQGDTALVPLFAVAMAQDWRRHGQGELDVVVPVPLHWTRQLRRGYNQAELLARMVARQLGLPCERLLRRRRRTAQQALLEMEARQKNIRGVFAHRCGTQTAGRRVLLVDDVLTTGATLGEAARVLEAAEAAAVSVLTAARG